MVMTNFGVLVLTKLWKCKVLTLGEAGGGDSILYLPLFCKCKIVPIK